MTTCHKSGHLDQPDAQHAVATASSDRQVWEVTTRDARGRGGQGGRELTHAPLKTPESESVCPAGSSLWTR
jgi:hypothetical protein